MLLNRTKRNAPKEVACRRRWKDFEKTVFSAKSRTVARARACCCGTTATVEGQRATECERRVSVTVCANDERRELVSERDRRSRPPRTHCDRHNRCHPPAINSPSTATDTTPAGRLTAPSRFVSARRQFVRHHRR